MSLGEFELIADYFQRQSDDPDLILDNGDDAAVIAATGANIAVSTDTLVESVHFPINANPELIARRALRVNLSDMAAMGAKPRWFTLALTLPTVDSQWLQGFSEGLFQDANAYGCQLIGGDTAKGPLNIGIQMLGEIAPNVKPLTRSGAEEGDLLVVTGTLGDAGAALNFDLNSDIQSSELLRRYWLPEPRIAFANKAAPFISAALDISDGLVADAGHICKQSNLAVVIELNKLPVSPALKAHCGDKAQLRALTSGDDYELCMAVTPDNWPKVQEVAENQGLQLTVIGRFGASPSSGVQVVDNAGNPLTMDTTGYKHF